MRNIYAVWERELNAYFTSPVAYVIVAVFLVLFGWFFYGAVMMFTMNSLQATTANPYMQSQLNLDMMVVRPLFYTLSVVLLIISPALTMRLFSEERKLGTYELIYTSPIGKGEWVIGKFAAAGTLLALMIILTAYAPMMLFSYGEPDFWPLISAYGGLYLMGLAFLAFGAFASSLTENQIIAAVIAEGGLLFLWLLAGVDSYVEGGLGQVVSYISIIDHFAEFNNGVIDTKHLVYYASFIFFFLTATVKTLDSQSWR